MMSEKEEKKDLAKYTDELKRDGRRTDLENVLSSELAIATFSIDPLVKIRHIFEAYFLLNDKEKESITPSERDRDEIEKLYAVVLGVQNIATFNGGMTIMPLPFSPEQSYKYYFFTKMRFIFNEVRRWKDEDFDVPENRKQYYEILTKHLTLGTNLAICLQIKTQLIQYAMRKALPIMRSILTKFISKETWESAMVTFGGKRQ